MVRPYGLLCLAALPAFGPVAAWGAGARTRVDIVLQIDKHDVEDLKGVDLTVTYPKDKLSLPGVGTTDEIRARVELLADDPERDDVFMAKVGDGTGMMRIVYARQPTRTAPTIGIGPTFRVTFDGTAVPSDLGCQITGTSDTNGQKYDGVRCSVSAAGK